MENRNRMEKLLRRQEEKKKTIKATENIKIVNENI